MKKIISASKNLIQKSKTKIVEESKKISKITLTVIIVVILVVAAFIFGVKTSEKTLLKIESTQPIEGIQNLELNKPENIDFSLFWDAWRYIEEYYLKSDNLDYQKMVYGAIRGMVDSLGDPYSAFFDPSDAKKFVEDVSGNFSGVGIEIGLKDNIITVIAPLEDTPAWKAGLKAGDKILAIDKELTDGLSIEEAVKKIRGEKGTAVTLTIMREGFDQSKDFTIIRDNITVPAVKIAFLDNNIAHVKLLNFNENAPFEFYRASLQIVMKNSPGIILDLRNNPGGYLNGAVDLGGWFLKRGEVVVREKEKDGRERLFKASGNQMFLNTPVVVLVNEGSASAAEILAGALRDIRGIKLIGTKTFGKGSVQTILPLIDNSMIKVTIAEWLTPNGNQINEKGLEPDFEVKNEENSDKDLQLEKALEILKEQIKNK